MPRRRRVPRALARRVRAGSSPTRSRTRRSRGPRRRGGRRAPTYPIDTAAPPGLRRAPARRRSPRSRTQPSPRSRHAVLSSDVRPTRPTRRRQEERPPPRRPRRSPGRRSRWSPLGLLVLSLPPVGRSPAGSPAGAREGIEERPQSWPGKLRAACESVGQYRSLRSLVRAAAIVAQSVIWARDLWKNRCPVPLERRSPCKTIPTSRRFGRDSR